MEQQAVRLDKFLTQSNIGTRKKVHEILAAGLISVNGEVETDAVRMVNPVCDVISYAGTEVKYRGKVYYMLHKPLGCICARSDEKHETVMQYMKGVETEGLFIVGRLDKNTQGLLLLTNDGAFDHYLMSPDSHVEKTYYFVAEGWLTPKNIEQLQQGIVIRKGNAKTMPARLSDIRNYYEMENKRGGTNLEPKRVEGKLTIKEGQKHQVRRMLRAVGCKVIFLSRIAIGEVELDEQLEIGAYRSLTEEEINSLMGNKMFPGKMKSL